MNKKNASKSVLTKLQETPTVINVFQSSKLQDLRSINKNDLIESKSILINENIYPILKISLSNCGYILKDFQRDLNNLGSHCEIVKIHNENNFLAIVTNNGNEFSQDLRKKIINLINNYQSKKLKYSSIDLNLNDLSNETFNLFKLIEAMKSQEHLDLYNQEKQMNLINKPFVTLDMSEPRFFEIYGYCKDVVDYTEYIQYKLKCDITLKVNAKMQPLFDILNKFDEKYFKELQCQLQKHLAIAFRQNDEIVVKYSDEKLKEHLFQLLHVKNLSLNLKVVNLQDQVKTWKSELESIVKKFSDKFSAETIQLKFGQRENLKFEFNRDKLDLIWISDKMIKIIGVNEAFKPFKRDLKIKNYLK